MGWIILIIIFFAIIGAFSKGGGGGNGGGGGSGKGKSMPKSAKIAGIAAAGYWLGKKGAKL